jgi:hypothetical protein
LIRINVEDTFLTDIRFDKFEVVVGGDVSADADPEQQDAQ